MTNLKHMIEKSIDIQSNDNLEDTFVTVVEGSHQQLLKEYVDLLDEQLTDKEKSTVINETENELFNDFKDNQPYTSHVYAHCRVIAQKSPLLKEVLIKYLSHKDVLYDNLRYVLHRHETLYGVPLLIDSRYITLENLIDFSKLYREQIKLEFDISTYEPTKEIINKAYDLLGIIPTIRLVNSDYLDTFLNGINEADKHEISYYMKNTTDAVIRSSHAKFDYERAKTYHEHGIASVKTLLRWSKKSNGALNYLFEQANESDRLKILEYWLQLRPLQELPNNLYTLNNGLNEILTSYNNPTVKNDFEGTQNALFLLESFVKQYVRYRDPSETIEVKETLLNTLDDMILRYGNVVRLSGNIITIIYKNSHFKVM